MIGINLKTVLCSSASFNLKCIKLFDHIIGSILCFLIPSRFQSAKRSLNLSSVKKVLIIRPGGIGDAVLTIPFIKEIKRLLNVNIDVLADKRNKEIYNLEPGLVDNLFCYNQGKIISLILRLRKNHYDVIFDSEQWHNFTAIVAYLSGAPVIVGFNTRRQRLKFYTHPVEYSQSEYEFYNFLNLLAAILPGEVHRKLDIPFLNIAASDSLPLAEFNNHKKKIVLCISASIPQRRWPAEKLKELIHTLLIKDVCVYLIGGKKETDLARLILDDINQDNLFNLAGRTTLKQAAVILKKADVFIGFDTGILHLANGLGIATVSLFGPGIKQKWALEYDRHIILDSNLDCSPCTVFGYTSHCQRDSECMETISVRQVLFAVERLISYD